jgi:hypothetical protein
MASIYRKLTNTFSIEKVSSFISDDEDKDLIVEVKLTHKETGTIDEYCYNSGWNSCEPYKGTLEKYNPYVKDGMELHRVICGYIRNKIISKDEKEVARESRFKTLSLIDELDMNTFINSI